MRTKDHVVPKSKGGTKTVWACIKCNAAKRDLSLEQFRALRGGIEFYGEMIARQEREKTTWIHEFNAENHTITPVADRKIITPVPASRPVYEATVDLSQVKQYPNAAKTKSRKKVKPANLPPDLLGVKFGAFTVVRRIVGKWEVECFCGAIEHRSSKAVTNPANTFDACVECRRPVMKLRSDIFKEEGVEVSWEDCFEHLYGRYLTNRIQDGIISSDETPDSCIQPE